MFKLGLIINPFAGIGGPLAFKGSDGEAVVSLARQRGGEHRAVFRAVQALQRVVPIKDGLKVFCFAGDMGESAAVECGLEYELVGQQQEAISCAEDTQRAAGLLAAMAVDLVLFVGGDGTARDIYQAVGSDFPVLGVPAGVKMHSGVYAVSPQAAGEILLRLLDGRLVDISHAEVRDIDEQAVREGRVRSNFYGELLVPRQGQFLQQVKSSGREVEELVVQDIAADIVESMEDDCLYIIGPGTTPQGIMEELHLDNTLLGVDVVCAGQLLANDVDEHTLLSLLSEHQGPAKIIITVIGGQGHILGRGNQQLSPSVIHRVGIDNILIIATKTKITELAGRPLLVDSNDPELDLALSGYRQVITGYHDAIMYQVGLQPDE